MQIVRVVVDKAGKSETRWGRIAGASPASIQATGTPPTARSHERIELLDGDPMTTQALPTGESVAREGARLLVPVVPSKIIAVGLNYRAHATEMGKALPEEPLLFSKPPSALLASGGQIARPHPGPGSVFLPAYQRVDFEGELGVVIGKRARRVSVAEALDFVFGYTICNDVTVRDLQKKDVQYTRAKGFDTFCPCGPVIATGLDPNSLRLRTLLNGEVRQDTSTEDMVFSVAELIAFISRVMTLEPGDLVSTGTPPGVGNLAAGDAVTVEIEGIGALHNTVVEEDIA